MADYFASTGDKQLPEGCNAHQMFRRRQPLREPLEYLLSSGTRKVHQYEAKQLRESRPTQGFGMSEPMPCGIKERWA
ncbi:hypothetical protein ACH4OY_15690 [Micromonospora rubida]|uniref:Uncharacterized protein n=1 Tax=Micromonospora rubida TaxID=2697657 RepID=A0ABW7SLS7_9ACTN